MAATADHLAASILRLRLHIGTPKWQEDCDAASCSHCRAEFTAWRRRHHCRCCQQVFCGACSQARQAIHKGLPCSENKTHVRLCIGCQRRSHLADHLWPQILEHVQQKITTPNIKNRSRSLVVSRPNGDKQGFSFTRTPSPAEVRVFAGRDMEQNEGIIRQHRHLAALQKKVASSSINPMCFFNLMHALGPVRIAMPLLVKSIRHVDSSRSSPCICFGRFRSCICDELQAFVDSLVDVDAWRALEVPRDEMEHCTVYVNGRPVSMDEVEAALAREAEQVWIEGMDAPFGLLSQVYALLSPDRDLANALRCAAAYFLLENGSPTTLWYDADSEPGSITLDAEGIRMEASSRLRIGRLGVEGQADASNTWGVCAAKSTLFIPVNTVSTQLATPQATIEVQCRPTIDVPAASE